jgi:hypothetical protein
MTALVEFPGRCKAAKDKRKRGDPATLAKFWVT